MVSAVEGGQNPKSFSEIHPGMLLIGFVKNIKDYGVFVQFPSGLSGLAPKAVSSASCTRAFEGRQPGHRPGGLVGKSRILYILLKHLQGLHIKVLAEEERR